MPKAEIRQRIQINFWDSFNPRELHKSTTRGSAVRGDHSVSMRLFDGRNVGRQERTNRMSSLHAPEGEEHIIWNWYARQNVLAVPMGWFHREGATVVDLLREPVFRAIDEFANVTTVELNVGTRPVLQLPLSDLFLGQSGNMTDVRIAPKIPQRQEYDVTIVSDRRALGRLLEVLPTDTAPESLIWVHLEGLALRKVNVQ